MLRDNRDSVMAMLEAFVYDPLISWRLLAKGDDSELKLGSRVNTGEEDEQDINNVDKVREQLSSFNSMDKDSSAHGEISLALNELSPKKASIVSASLRDIGSVRRSKSQDGNGDDEPFQENVNAR